MSLAYKMIHSPVGNLKLVASDQGLVAVLWQNEKPTRVPLNELVEDTMHPILLDTERELGEYFAGKRKTFSVPLDMRGTSFQKDVWHALLAIPFGETRSYGQLAKQLGNPSGHAGCRCREWKKPDIHYRALPSCDRFIGKTYGFRWRPRNQSALAESGGKRRQALCLKVVVTSASAISPLIARLLCNPLTRNHQKGRGRGRE